MSEPQLQRANITDVVLQVSRGKGMTEFVQEPVGAVLAFCAFVSVPRGTAAAVQASLVGDSFQLPLVLLVWFACRSREYQIVRIVFALALFVSLQLSNQ